MTYAELYPSLIDRKLITPRDPPAVSTNPQWWYKPELHCVYHSGAPGHDVENFYPTKVQDLVRSGILFFEDVGPNMKKNPLPEHGKAVVNMVQGCPGKYKVLIPKPVVIKYDGSKKKVSPSLVIKPAGPVPYSSNKVVPYRYNVVMLEDGKEVSLPSTYVLSISDISGVTRSGRVFSAPPKPHEDFVGKAVVNPAGPVGTSSNNTVVKGVDPVVDKTVKAPVLVGQSGVIREDGDEMLRLIKRSEYNVVDQLLQTPSKISVLSLLMNSKPRREALQRVLDVAYVDYDITIEQFDSIVANINAYTGSSLNVLPKSTLTKLSYQGPPMRQSGVVVKAFDGSRKTMIGEVELPIKIGPSDFQITFQVMDIHPSYNCLLGKSWIHEAGVVTSTLHQKLKFVKNKKLVVIGGEKALFVSHLSSFSYIDVEDEVGTPFQALSIAEPSRKGPSSFASCNDAKLAIEHGATTGLGKMIRLEDNKSRAGIGFSSGISNERGQFQSGGFIHTVKDQELAAIVEDDEEEDLGNFIIPGGIYNNWVAVDVPTVIHKSTLIKPIEHNDPTPSPNFEFLVFEAEEDDVEEIPDEITRLLEHEEKII
ncbi:hypothetical protein KIW84_013274 [Lathyrus oleraceus]|uniref:Uncharacterized protein n=1 Tax=Pisum sativum TaxID=3888 RepID=A0A9D5GXT9_PEA|nr:hypothetical protein KIW84_013274 [Pisum sativum]